MTAPSEGESAVARMRAATRSEHERTERAVEERFFDGGMDRHRYRRYLEALLGFYRPMEARLAPLVRRHLDELDPPDWTARIERDLGALGRTQSELAELQSLPEADLPAVGGPHRLLGSLYVLEGAELGGRVIWKRIRGELDPGALEANAFLATDADRTRRHWQHFRAAFDRRVDTGEAFDEALSAARSTFRVYRGWMA